MKTTSSARSFRITRPSAALLAAFLLPFLPGCSKTPEDHARIASDPGVRFEKNLASVEALAAANEQLLLAGVAADSRNPDIKRAAAEKLTDQTLLADIAKKNSNGNVRTAAVKKLTGPAAPAQ
jgi:hypothetical protein